MPLDALTRRRFAATLLSSPFWHLAADALPDAGHEVSIAAAGAVADDATVNTRAIQAVIDGLAAKGGGTVVVPKGTFVSGALFFKPQVHLRLEEGAVLKCSTDLSNFPEQRTRIEGHFEEHFNPALINASGCDGFRLSGPGTLDGAGRPIWDLFWKLRNASPEKGNFRNVGVPRARLALIENSRNVVVEGVTFKDSQFWNLHLYRCDGVEVRNARFQVPDDYKQAPSTDGIDLDSCRNVTIDGCYFSVTDDCIAAKGSKGPHADEDRDSPPVEHIRIRHCTYKRGGGVLTLGSEATLVRDVQVEHCRVTGPVRIATLKLRPDTPQHYEDISFRDIELESPAASVIAMRPWSQYVNLQGAAPPRSVVHNIRMEGIRGKGASFGVIAPNPGQTTISDIRFKDLDLQLTQPKLDISGVTGLLFDHVTINGVVVPSPEMRG